MTKRIKYTGINIQFPISQLILEGSKTIETRTYPIPKAFIGKEMIIIETPGKGRDTKARMIGTVVFGESFKYKSKKSFYEDSTKHSVTPDSPWKWVDKPKWGWPILKVKKIDRPFLAPKKKGILYTHGIEL
jgi:hypothetical protein